MRKALLASALLASAPAAAQMNCAVTAIVPGFAPGQARMADALAPGAAVELPLKPADGVRYRLPLARAPEAGSRGGAFALTVPAAGTYRIAVSAKAWIDVVGDGAALVPTGHEHGAPCSGIAKIVAFQLEKGDYTLQLSEVAASTIVAKVTREPALPTKR